MVDDYLMAEDLIVNRLKAAVPLMGSYLNGDQLENLKDTQFTSPALSVIYSGENLVPAGATATQRADQIWTIVVVVQNINDLTGKKARTKAGPIMTQVIKALKGWQPSPHLGKMARAPAPGTIYTPDAALFPLSFTTAITSDGEG